MARYLLPLPRLPQVERCTRLTLRRVRFGAGGDGARNAEGLRVVPWRPPILLWRLRDAALVRGREAASRGLRYGRRLRRPGAVRAGGAPSDPPEARVTQFSDDMPRYRKSSKSR